MKTNSLMFFIHHVIVFLNNRFRAYPNIRRSAHIEADVHLHKDIVVGKWSQINGSKKHITSIGKNVFIGRNVHICEGVTIGNNVTIGHLTQIGTCYRGLEGANVKLEPIVIEDGVFINGFVAISKGIRLGKGCIAMVGAIIFDDVPPYGVVQGNPAKLIGFVDKVVKKK